MHPDDLALFERSLRHATATHSGAGLDAALVELGWREALDSDAEVAVSLLFELQGAANVTSSALGRVIAQGVHCDIPDTTAVVLPAVGRADAPGRSDGGRIHVDGVVTGGRDGWDAALVVAGGGDGHLAVVSDRAALAVRPIRGVDPSLGLVEVSGILTPGDTTRVVDWRAGVALGQVALAHELVGASSRMLDMACEHALGRFQFDRPIASFQAVRHRLAETLVAIETARAILVAAWTDRTPMVAAMAKAVAARGARTTARHCQQVLAGIGFTTEHDLYRYVRRVLVLEQLLGATRTLTRDLGTDVLDTGRVPELLPL